MKPQKRSFEDSTGKQSRGKKASANMWWIIIGAVIALVVMIVLMVMFTGKSHRLEVGLMECTGKGGTCVIPENCAGTVSRAFDCPNSDEVCCFEESGAT